MALSDMMVVCGGESCLLSLTQKQQHSSEINFTKSLKANGQVNMRINVRVSSDVGCWWWRAPLLSDTSLCCMIESNVVLPRHSFQRMGAKLL